MVAAGQGNLVDPLGTRVNFQDLTLLLAAWTGPGGAASPQAAVTEAIAPDATSVSTRDTASTESRIATTAHFDRLGRRDHATLRRANRASALSSHDSPLRRLQATAVDRAMGEDSDSMLVGRKPAFVRRRR